MFDHVKINNILIKNGFDRTESGGCWVNRINNKVVYKGSYSPSSKSKTNYTVCIGENRKFAYSEEELENILNDNP